MAYSVNRASKVVTIPKADTVLVSSSPDVRSLDVTTLWQTLIDIQDGEEGIPYLDIVKNTPPLTVAGVTLARVVEIINGYTITFENLQYAVNIIGGNSNLADKVNKNQVSVNTGNSAGFTQGADDSRISNIQSLVTEILGLSMKNAKVTGITWDAFGNMLTGTLKVYSSRAALDAESSAGLLYTYDLTSATDANGKNLWAKQGA